MGQLGIEEVRPVRMSLIPLVLGLWLIAAPFVLGYSGVSTAMFNDVIVGIAVAASSYLLVLRRAPEKQKS